MIHKKGMGRFEEFASGYMWCPRAIGACGWMVCSVVDVGARSFVECQPAALAPGTWILRESLPPGDGKQGHHPEAPSRGPSHLDLVSAPYLITDKISPNFIPPQVNFRETW